MTLTPRMKENSRLPKEHTVCSSQNHIRLTLDLSFLARVPSQSCPTTLYNSMDPPGSSLHGIRQARILEWVAISFSRASSQPGDQTSLSYGFCVGRQVPYPLSHWVDALLRVFTKKCVYNGESFPYSSEVDQYLLQLRNVSSRSWKFTPLKSNHH